MRTTIDLPDELFREAKSRAAREGRKLKDLFAEYVERGLRRSDPGPNGASRTRSLLPLARAATGRMLPSLTNADLYHILEEEEAGKDVDGSPGC